MGGPTNGGRSRSLHALRDSEDLNRAVLSNVSDAVFLTDDNGHFTFVCPNVDVIFGFVPDEVHAMTHIGGLLGENLFDISQLKTDGEIRNVEREVTSKSGARRTLLINIKNVSIEGGTVLYACRDVTERKAAEEEARSARLELNHAMRLAMIGELLASIVHEVRQPMTAIGLNASAGLRLLESDAGRAKELREILSDIRDQSHHAGSVVEGLQALARKQAFQQDVIEVDEVIRELAGLVANEAWRRGVRLDFELGAAAVKVKADRVFLRQVILNLLVNAMDAVNHADRDRLVTMRTRRAGDIVEITVSANGHGISPEHAPRIFESSFTTKETGVGLGLALSRSLAKEQGGRLTLVETTDRGTTFSLTLPVHADLQ